ncbi:MAG: hypothetical protein FWD57_06690 [Polyangiaceae bacterium]|nr:hypothetical protein [Polyangiaceae bacterium]
MITEPSSSLRAKTESEMAVQRTGGIGVRAKSVAAYFRIVKQLTAQLHEKAVVPEPTNPFEFSTVPDFVTVSPNNFIADIGCFEPTC